MPNKAFDRDAKTLNVHLSFIQLSSVYVSFERFKVTFLT